jgi:predicted flavoprotein YhiN
MKNVTESLVGVAFARGLAMSELGSTGATWRPATTMQAPTQAPTHTAVPNTYAAAAAVSAIAALPTVKTNVATAAQKTMQHLVKTDAGRDNRPTEGPSSRRIPV